MKPTLKDLDKLPLELIKDFRATKQSKAIPEYLQKYILHIDKVAEIRNVGKEHNITTTARSLMETFPELGFDAAKRRVDDAINYFHLNSTVKKEALDNYYADRMEDMAKYAISCDNITEARRCMEKAREFRNEAANNSINPNDFKPVTQLISPEVTAKRLGFKDDFDLKTMWTNTSKFINELPVDQRDKNRALKDASDTLGIEDVDYEEV